MLLSITDGDRPTSESKKVVDKKNTNMKPENVNKVVFKVKTASEGELTNCRQAAPNSLVTFKGQNGRTIYAHWNGTRFDKLIGGPLKSQPTNEAKKVTSQDNSLIVKSSCIEKENLSQATCSSDQIIKQQNQVKIGSGLKDVTNLPSILSRATLMNVSTPSGTPRFILVTPSKSLLENAGGKLTVKSKDSKETTVSEALNQLGGKKMQPMLIKTNGAVSQAQPSIDKCPQPVCLTPLTNIKNHPAVDPTRMITAIRDGATDLNAKPCKEMSKNIVSKSNLEMGNIAAHPQDEMKSGNVHKENPFKVVDGKQMVLCKLGDRSQNIDIARLFSVTQSATYQKLDSLGKISSFDLDTILVAMKSDGSTSLVIWTGNFITMNPTEKQQEKIARFQHEYASFVSDRLKILRNGTQLFVERLNNTVKVCVWEGDTTDILGEEDAVVNGVFAINAIPKLVQKNEDGSLEVMVRDFSSTCLNLGEEDYKLEPSEFIQYSMNDIANQGVSRQGQASKFAMWYGVRILFCAPSNCPQIIEPRDACPTPEPCESTVVFSILSFVLN